MIFPATDCPWAERSARTFPAASNGEFNLPAELATVIRNGRGCEIYDMQGRRFLDFSMGWGSALVGHAREEVVEAIRSQLDRGLNFAYVTESSLRLAEEIIRISPACQRIRFCASGTEANLYCVRLARAYTGKPAILKFEGAYHGASEIGVTSLFPVSPPPFPCPDTTSSSELRVAFGGQVLVAPFNDLDTTATLIEQHAGALAAVIVEPLQRCLPPEPGFLEGLRRVTAEQGVLLIFDEVVTGFRLAYGGAQECYGVVPDLIAYGKALGGGMPIGAYGGREDIMEIVREDRLGRDTYLWTASTLGGNPLSAAASLAALGVLRAEGVYERLYELGDYLREGIRRCGAESGVSLQPMGRGPLA